MSIVIWFIFLEIQTKIRYEFAPFQETFKVTVMYFDTIVDTREGLNRIMGHFTSIECNYRKVASSRLS